MKPTGIKPQDSISSSSGEVSLTTVTSVISEGIVGDFQKIIGDFQKEDPCILFFSCLSQNPKSLYPVDKIV